MRPGAIFTYGTTRPDGGDLLELWRKLRVSVVVDYRRREQEIPAPQLYTLARSGERLLLLGKVAAHSHAALMLPIAQDQARYAESALNTVVARIDLAHVLGDLLVEPLEYEVATVDGRKPKGKRWSSRPVLR